MTRFKAARLWLVIGLGIIPFTGLPLAVQVGLAVGDVVLLMALSAIARNPGTVAGSGADDGGTFWTSFRQEDSRDDTPDGTPGGAPETSGEGGGAADSGQAADGGDSGGDGGGGGD